MAFSTVEKDSFGRAVSLYEDIALVGAPNHDGGRGFGAAYIFEKSGSTWTEVQKLTPSDLERYDGFGFAVAIYGDFALISSLGDDDNGSNSGSAYVFQKIDGIWTETQKLTASDGVAEDDFGRRVTLYADVAVIAATGQNDNAGAAYIFRNNGGVWTEEQKLTASDASPSNHFGFSISVYDEIALIGAFGNDDFSGSAYLYKRVDGVWSEVQKLKASDASGSDNFGYSVAVSDDVALIGARRTGGDTGSAYIFQRSNSEWTQVQKLVASDGAAGDAFGISVAVYENTAIMGAEFDEDNGTWSGSAYIFRSSDGIWTEDQKLLASDGSPGDRFGSAVSLWGSNALIGAYQKDEKGGDSGAAFVIDIATVTSIESIEIHAGIVLGQAYPNPFHAETIIPFDLPRSSHVSLAVYDMLGREVVKLVDGVRTQGRHSVAFDARGLPSGMYIFRLESSSGVASKTFHLVN